MHAYQQQHQRFRIAEGRNLLTLLAAIRRKGILTLDGLGAKI